jgi:hypothetical protein
MTRFSYFSTDTDATIMDGDNPAALSTETTSISLSEEDVSSFDSPPSLSAPPSQLLEEDEKDNKEIDVNSYETGNKYSNAQYREMTERYLHMNVTEDPPSQHDLLRMKFCIQFWQGKNTFHAWENSSQLYQQLILSLKQQQDQKVLDDWYKDKNTPDMTFFLNAVVDQWRIMRGKENQQKSSYKSSFLQGPTPSQMLDQIMAWKSMEPMLLLNSRSYTLIMQAAVEVYNDEESPMLCDSIFRKMLPSQSSSVDQRTLPNYFTYTHMILAWSKCHKNPEATERLWNLFNEIQQLHKDGILENPLEPMHYAMVIGALMRPQQIDWMNRAEQVFQQAQELLTPAPLRGAYLSYLHGWLFYKDLTLEKWHQCKAILNEALERSTPQNPLANASIFARFIVTAGKLGRDDLSEQTYIELCQWYKQLPVSSMAPDVYCWNALIHTYSRTLRPYLAEQALFTLIHEVNAKKCPELGPKAHHFEIVIQSWLQQMDSKEDGLERAEQLLMRAVKLDKQLGLNLSSQSLNWIIKAWSQSGLRNAPYRAAALLKAFQSESTIPVRSFTLELVKTMQSPSYRPQKTTSNTN